MRLLKAYVAGFGTLVNKTYDLNKDVLSIIEDNGKGKTTLGDFIKAMFYEMPRDAGKNGGQVKTDRLRYLPFDTGVYGGSLEFNHQGSLYKIERKFSRSTSGDTIRMFKDGRELTEFDRKNPGIQFFNMDRESFQKTYLSQGFQDGYEPTGDIKKRLSGFIEEGEGTLTVDEAVNKLKEARKRYKSPTNGMEALAKTKRDEAKAAYQNLKAEVAALGQARKDMEEAETLKKEAEEKSAAALSNKQKKDNIAKLKAERERLEAYKKNKEDILAPYPNGLPSREEFLELRDMVNSLKSLQNETIEEENEQSKADFARLSGRFANGVPSNDDLKATEKALWETGALKKEIKALEEEIEKAEPKEEIPPDKIALLESQVQEVHSKKKAYDSLSDSILKETPKGKNNRMLEAVILVVMVLFVSLGVLLGALVNAYLYSLIGVGVLVLGIGFFLLRKPSSSSASLPIPNPKKQKAKEEYTKALSTAVSSFLAIGKQVDENSLDQTLIEVKFSNAETINANQARISKIKQKEEKENEAKGKEAKAKALIAGYGYGPDLESGLNSLNKDVSDYLDLKKEHERLVRLNDSRKKKEDSLKKAIADFLKGHPGKSENPNLYLDQVDGNSTSLLSLNKDIERSQEEIKRLEGLIPEGDQEEEMEEIDLDAIKEDFLIKKRAYIDLEGKAKRLDDAELAYEQANKDLSEVTTRINNINKAIAILQEADSALKARYMDPLNKSLAKYLGLASALLNKQLYVDQDFRINYTEGGFTHDEGHLSSGEKALVYFCLRLSIIEQMTGSSVPFLVLDDPFYSLDEANMDRARELIAAISQDTQVIYLSCHPSRNLTL